MAKSRGEEIDLPDVDEQLQYLIEALFEAGPTSAAGMGEIVLSWADLAAYEHGAGIEFRPWESRVLRQLSGEYLMERHRGTGHMALPPWRLKGAPASPEDKAKTAESLKRFVRSL